MVTPKRTTKQPGDPRASLLLTSEKVVYCKIACHHRRNMPKVIWLSKYFGGPRSRRPCINFVSKKSNQSHYCWETTIPVQCPSSRKITIVDVRLISRSLAHWEKFTCPRSRKVRPGQKSCTPPYRCCPGRRCMSTFRQNQHKVWLEILSLSKS